MTDQEADKLAARIAARLGDALVASRYACGELSVEVRADDITRIATILRDAPEFAYAQLSDLAAVDYSTYGQADWSTQTATSSGFSRAVGCGRTGAAASQFTGRFAVVYQLLSLVHNRRLRVTAFATGDPPRVASVTAIWPSADWYEREAFDLFGVLFDGHPDLRRILTDYGFIGHPFRKDFPLEGYVEVRYDPDKNRVVYQPVTIENRVLVPRVIRDDVRKSAAQAPGGAGGDA